MRRYLLLALTTLIGPACSTADVREPAMPQPLSAGQLAVSVPDPALRAGSNLLYFNVVRYDGSPQPKAIAAPLNKAQVTVRLLGDEAPPSTVTQAQFIEDGAPLAAARADARSRANYVARLELPASGAGVMEFLLEDEEQSRRIEVPVRVGFARGGAF